MENYAQPVLPGRGKSDYERYLRTEELLSLQKSADERVHRDELLFQTVHQSSELWLKLAAAELEEAGARLAHRDLQAAERLLRRACDCLTLLTPQLHMLEHMSPWEYQTIRRVLGHGSGFDSPGFAEVLRVSPPLGEAFRSLVAAAGLTIVELYRRGRDFEDLYQLAERLIDWDEHVILWRFHHFQIVQRIIGAHVIGTQGTPVEVLGKRIPHQFYPDLWDARDQLTKIAKEIG
jgi:tryptophan 2,3-dioxygenase